MPSRASFEEVLAFANKVREAGGGDIIPALLPGEPALAPSCLIARNLNFDCSVEAGAHAYPGEEDLYDDEDGEGFYRSPWAMLLPLSHGELAEKIAGAIGSKAHKDTFDYLYAIPLPASIGQVAYDFDRADAVVHKLQHSIAYGVDGDDPVKGLTDSDREVLVAMWPYISDDTKMRYDIKIEIREDGSLDVSDNI